jgi:YesK-like protein
MVQFWLLVIILTLIIIGISLLFKNKIAIMFLVPCIFLLIGVVILIVSFIIGRWTGMSLSIVSISVFIASAISLIVLGVIGYIRSK